MILAIIVYLTIASAVTALEPWIVARCRGQAITEWYAQHIYLPFLRAIVVLVFVVLAYPAVFGLTDAPSFLSLIRGEAGRGTTLLNVLLLLALALPLLPITRRIPGVVLLLQGMVATSLVFAWLVHDTGRVGISSWPGVRIFLAALAFALVSYALARVLVWSLHSDERSTLALIAREGLRLYGALPALLLYGTALGKQL